MLNIYNIMERLRKIASIRLGMSAQVQASVKGDVRLVQMKDLKDNSNSINMKEVMRIEGSSDLRKHHALEVGDILFRSRGLATTARLLTEKTGPTIVAAPIFVIRVKSEFVSPRYLVWWINQPASQAYFRSRSDNSLIRIINKQTLGDLQVDLPSIETQEKIADFYDLTVREQTLLSEIKIKRRHYAHRIMRQMVSDSFARKTDLLTNIGV